MKVVLFANTDWYLFNFRLSLAEELRRRGCELVLWSPDGDYGPRLRALGFDWRPIPMRRRSLNPVSEAALLLHLVGLLRRERPDLIHNFTLKCAVYGSLAAKLAGGVARVNAVAGLGYVFTNQKLDARLLRPVVRGLLRASLDGARARLVVQNPDDRDFILSSRIAAPDRIALIPGSGVDCRRFQPGPPRAADGPMKVLLVARLLWDKGVREYVEAARRLKAQGRPIRFLLAGDSDPGNPAAVPEAAVRAWVDEGVVEWLGHVSDMAALLADVDVVALPSYREGLPKSLIEAAACALPLVTYDVPGCREVVTHEEDGLLLPAKSIEPLAEAIARLQDDPALAARLGAAARAKALARFDQEIIVQRTIGVYGELIEEEGEESPVTAPAPALSVGQP